jgi:phenylacetate-CoA ligase
MTANGLRQLIDHLDASQWEPATTIEDGQRQQLARLMEHAYRESPYFVRRLAAAGLRLSDVMENDGFTHLPVLTRRDIQTAGNDLWCRNVPATHGPVHVGETSGSTGEPIAIHKTGLTRFIWMAMTMRDHEWHRRDLSGRLAVVRPHIRAPERRPDWGPPASELVATGESLLLPIDVPGPRLVDWIANFDPQHLLIYPSTLDTIARYCGDTGVSLPSLSQIRTMGETLHPEVRSRAGRVFGIPVVDCYSSREIGYLALTCPVSGVYHVMAEGVLIELINDAGQPCQPGEVGRVTITDLHNFATPMVRYDIGDYAEAAAPCGCGRGLPTCARILGRSRNLIRMPDGSRHWPITGFPRCREFAPILQYQLVQCDYDTIEARLVVERPLSSSEEAALQLLFRESSGHAFTMRFSYFTDRIPPLQSGKFEDFISLVADMEPGCLSVC